MRSRGEVVGVIEFFLTEVTGPDPELLAAMEGLCAQLATVFVRRRNERELARRAADLERSNADLEQFASVASHDLSEPLRTISGFATLLERRYKGQLDEDADVFLGHVLAGTERMRALIDGLLAYSRASRADLDPERVDLGQVVEHVQRALAAAIDESGAEIVVGELPVVIGDAGRLGQVLQNLIANAIKFRGDEPPRVTVDAHPLDGDVWRVEVADNGSGIDAEHAERLFEMFRRGAGVADHPGEGIGLALCKRIVERHGGTIWAQAPPQGGTLVAFTLPDAPLSARRARPTLPGVAATDDTTAPPLSRAQQATVRRVAESRATVPDATWTARADVTALAAGAARGRGGDRRRPARRRAGAARASARQRRLPRRALGAARPRQRRDWRWRTRRRSSSRSIPDADTLELAELASRRRELAERVRSGGLASRDLAGGTFTFWAAGDEAVESVVPGPRPAAGRRARRRRRARRPRRPRRRRRPRPRGRPDARRRPPDPLRPRGRGVPRRGRRRPEPPSARRPTSRSARGRRRRRAAATCRGGRPGTTGGPGWFVGMHER